MIDVMILVLCFSRMGLFLQRKCFSLFHVKDLLKWMDFCPGMDEEPTESSWIWFRGRTGTGDIIDSRGSLQAA